MWRRIVERFVKAMWATTLEAESKLDPFFAYLSRLRSPISQAILAAIFVVGGVVRFCYLSLTMAVDEEEAGRPPAARKCSRSIPCQKGVVKVFKVSGLSAFIQFERSGKVTDLGWVDFGVTAPFEYSKLEEALATLLPESDLKAAAHVPAQVLAEHRQDQPATPTPGAPTVPPTTTPAGDPVAGHRLRGASDPVNQPRAQQRQR